MESRIWSRKSRSSTAAAALDEAVGERRLAVVDVGDDAEVADVVHGPLELRSNQAQTRQSSRRMAWRRPQRGANNFGKEWDITLTNCADANSGKCVDGFRDIGNELGCGPLPVYGTFVNAVLSVVALDDDTDTCISVGWRGSYNGVSVSGSFKSEVSRPGPSPWPLRPRRS